MKKRLAGFVATGALAVGALAGTVGNAHAGVVTPDLHGRKCSEHHPDCFYWDGPYYYASDCVNYVVSIGQLGNWDCEYYNPAWFNRPNQTPGWYATSVYFPKSE